MTAQDKVTFDRLTVLPDRIEALVRINDPKARTTSPSLIEAILAQYPTLPLHVCRNDAGPSFGAVMNQTSVPHLLEHLVIDMQTRQLAQDPAAQRLEESTAFTGTTQWSADDPNLAIVRVSFRDDLVALSAFKKALHLINQILDRP